jgi:hypothetical protein
MARKQFVRKRGTYMELDGQSELRQAFLSLNSNALAAAKGVIADSAARIEADAKARIRFEDPDLNDKYEHTRGTIRTTFRDFGLVASVGTGFFKGRLLEFGTRFMAAFPWLNPAYQQERPRYLANLSAAIGRAVEQASKSRRRGGA